MVKYTTSSSTSIIMGCCNTLLIYIINKVLTLFLLKINTILTIINRVLTLGYSVDSGQIGKVTHLYVQLIIDTPG